MDLGRHPPCHKHRLSPHFSLLGLFGGQEASAAHTALERALTRLHGSGGPTPRATGKEGREGPGEKISQCFPFAVASWQGEAGSAVSIFLQLPATAASQYRLGLALILPESDLSFSFVLPPTPNKTANLPFLHAEPPAPLQTPSRAQRFLQDGNTLFPHPH